MRTIKYKYSEKYRGQDIFIYGTSREWIWQVVIHCRVSASSMPHFSLKAAVNAAQKYIDNKIL